METPTATLTSAEREGNALGGLFQNIITDLRAGANNWDDLLLKANKFHLQLKSTISSSTAFLDAFQKIADMATTTRGGTKEIGSALTRLCLRNRSVEAKLKSLTSSLFDSFILPLQDRVDEWKKIIVQIDKEHNKEIKRLKQFRKKHSSETRVSSGFSNNTFRMKKHPRSKLKSDFPRIGSMYDVDKIIESSDNKEKYFMLEEVERNYVRRALIEERSHYCLFFNLFRPVIEEEISMLQEIIHLEEILTTLSSLTNDPLKLPTSSENFLTSLQLYDSAPLDSTYSEYGSQVNSHSRKSSISSMDSLNTLSTDSISFRNVKSLSQPNITPGFRPKSIASQDSGFLSHDYNIPNIGRLVIYNHKNKNAQSKDPICLLNGKPVLCSSRVESNNKEINEINCNVEYATSAPLFQNHDSLCQQPIYANIRDSYPTSSRGHFASEGSVTPTNQDTEDNYIKSLNNIKTMTKPKPPVRHSSKLSNGKSMDLSVSDNLNKRSTLIYVQDSDNSQMDFPPPPPEAYITIRPADQRKINENLCCRYSVPSSHLVFCDKQECLNDLEPINHTKESIDCMQQQIQYGSHTYASGSSNAYSFESNLEQKCRKDGTWRQQATATASTYYENGGSCEDTKCHNPSFDNQYNSVNLSNH